MQRSLPMMLAIALLPVTAWADNDWLLGLNLQADDADGTAVTAFGELAVGDSTWLSGALGRSEIDIADSIGTESLYADLGIDHRFGLIGVRLTAAYWGDPDLLDSRDLRGRLYLSGERGSVGIEFEERDFEFELPPLDFLQRTSFPFDASGIGLSGSLKLGENVDVYVSGKEYDYSIAFRRQESDRIRPLLTISRLSVLSSLVDWRVSGGIGIDVGEQRWSFDVSSWEGVITGSRNDSYALGFQTPISLRVDMGLELAQDRSDFAGDVTVFSLRFFYYGGE